MERNQLICVVAVAEYGSVARATERLHLPQPSLSNQITHLEQGLGITLPTRVRKRVHLTEVGEVFIYHTRRILNNIRALVEHMEDYAANRSRRVRIGALPIMCAPHISGLIGDFRSEYPSIVLILQEWGSAELLQVLEQSETDVAFTILNLSKPTVGQVYSPPLLQSKICTIVRIDNPLTRRDAIELEQLADQTSTTSDQGFNLSGIILSHLSSLGISCQVRNICNQINSCLALVNKNVDISFCSHASTDYYRYPGMVSVSIKPAISRTVYPVCKEGLAFYPSLQYFVHFAVEF